MTGLSRFIRRTGQTGTSSRLHIYGWVLSYLRRYWKMTMLFVIVGLVVNVIELTIPKFVQYFIDVLIPGKNAAAFRNTFVILLAAIVCLLAVQSATRLIQRILQEKPAKDLITEDRGSVAEHGSHEELLEREGVYRRSSGGGRVGGSI